MGLQEIHEHEALGGDHGRRLYCRLTSLSRSLQTILRINLDGTGHSRTGIVRSIRGLGRVSPTSNREISGIRKSSCSSSLYKRRHCLPSVLPRGHSCGSTTSYDTLQQKGAFIMSSYFPALSSALRYPFLPNPDHNRCHIRSCGSRGRDHPTFQEEHPSIRDDSSTSPR